MNIKKLFDKPVKCSAVIVAAGSSRRMGEDKTMMEIGGVPVLARTLKVFDESPQVDEIVLVTRMDKIEQIANFVKNHGISKVTKVIAGGQTRIESCLAGVASVKKTAEYIAIHDAARPFVTPELISACLEGAKKYRAAVPGIPVADTLKKVEDGFSAGNVDRESVVRIQTPQIFESDLIKGALTCTVEKKLLVTDDSSAVELCGFRVKIIPGDEDNIKLTEPSDLDVAEAILRKRERN